MKQLFTTSCRSWTFIVVGENIKNAKPHEIKKQELNNLLYCSKKEVSKFRVGIYILREILAAFFLGTEMLNLSKRNYSWSRRYVYSFVCFVNSTAYFNPKNCYSSKSSKARLWIELDHVECFIFLSVERRIFITMLPGRSKLKAFRITNFLSCASRTIRFAFVKNHVFPLLVIE